MDELEPSDLATWEVDDLPSDFEERVLVRLRGEGLADEEDPAVEFEPPTEATVHSLEPRRRRRLGIAATAVAVAAAVALTWGLVVRSPSEPRSGAIAASDALTTVELMPGVEARVSPGGTLTWEADDALRVQQTHGLVRYEVTPGTAVAVRTPAGTIDVTGTIFSVEVLTMSDVSTLKSRSIFIAAAAAAATVLAVVVVHEGSVGASNEHGTAEVAAGERVVMTDASPPRTADQDDEPPQVAQAPEPPPTKKSYVSPEQRRQHAMTRKRIEDALARRKAATPEPPETPAAPREDMRTVIDGDLDKEYIRNAIREDLIPLAQECYSNVLEVDPEFGGKLVIDFDIMGDEDVGGIVDDVQPGEGTDVIHPEFVECMSESMMTVMFPPPEGGGVVHVSYPLLFEFE